MGLALVAVPDAPASLRKHGSSRQSTSARVPVSKASPKSSTPVANRCCSQSNPAVRFPPGGRCAVEVIKSPLRKPVQALFDSPFPNSTESRQAASAAAGVALSVLSIEEGARMTARQLQG
jgi:hypothetical protein